MVARDSSEIVEGKKQHIPGKLQKLRFTLLKPILKTLYCGTATVLFMCHYVYWFRSLSMCNGCLVNGK